MYCLDANVWVYYFDAGLPEHSIVSTPVSDLVADQPLFTTTVLQMEVIHYLCNQLADSQTIVDRFLTLEDMLVADLTREDVTVAAELLHNYANVGVGGRDATVIAAMRRYDVSTLWTHDAGLKRLGKQLDWITVSDPVEESQS